MNSCKYPYFCARPEYIFVTYFPTFYEKLKQLCCIQCKKGEKQVNSDFKRHEIILMSKNLKNVAKWPVLAHLKYLLGSKYKMISEWIFLDLFAYLIL